MSQMTERPPNLTLIYFRFSAEAEALRLAAAIGKIPFTNKAIEFDEWEPPGAPSPRNQLPVLEIDRKGHDKQVISETSAILRYLGRRGGLYPADSLEGLQVEYMLDTVSEALHALQISCAGAVKSLISDTEWTDKELITIRQRIAKDNTYGLPHYFELFELALRSNSDSNWLVGTDVSIADLQLYHLVCWVTGGIGEGDGPSLLEGIENSIIRKYPFLKAHKKKVETLHEVVAWRRKYSPPYSVFEFRPPFEFRSLGRRARLERHQELSKSHSLRLISVEDEHGKRHASYPKLTLTYFDIPGRAEPIRLAAAIAKIPFTNRVFSHEEWQSVKAFAPLRQLPTLTIVQPGKDILNAPQSNAILRYIGKLGGLYPVDDVEAVQVDFIIEAVMEASSLIEMTVSDAFDALFLFGEWTEEAMVVIRKRVAGNQECGLPFFLGFFDNVLRENKESGWLVGNSLTIADLRLFHLICWLSGDLDGGVLDGTLGGIDPTILDDYPYLRRHKEAVENFPGVECFRSLYHPPYETFNYNPDQDYGESRRRSSRFGDHIPRGIERQLSAEQCPGSPLGSTLHSPPGSPGGYSPAMPVRRGSSLADIDSDDLAQPDERRKAEESMLAPVNHQRDADDEMQIPPATTDDPDASEEEKVETKSEDNTEPSETSLSNTSVGMCIVNDDEQQHHQESEVAVAAPAPAEASQQDPPAISAAVPQESNVEAPQDKKVGAPQATSSATGKRNNVKRIQRVGSKRRFPLNRPRSMVNRPRFPPNVPRQKRLSTPPNTVFPTPKQGATK